MPKVKPKPSVHLHDYFGPYNRQMLEDARQVLLDTIDSKDSVMWTRIKNKTGIHRNGERDASLPGWGEASTEFSHADLRERQASAGVRDTHGSQDNTLDIIFLDNEPGPNFPRQSSTMSSSTRNSTEVIDLDNYQYQPQSYKSDGSTVGTATQGSSVIIVDEYNNEHVLIEDGPSTSHFQSSLAAGCIPMTKSSTRSTKNEATATSYFGKDECKVRDSKAKNESERGDVEKLASNDGDVRVADSMGVEVKGGEIENKPNSDTDDANFSGIPEIIGSKDDHLPLGKLELEEKSAPEQTMSSNCVVPSHVGDVATVVYKCDYCDWVSATDSQVEQHLEGEGHYSASSYFADHDGRPISLKDRLVKVHKPSLHKNMLVVCPLQACSKVFATTHECSLHYTLKHEKDKNKPPIFGLVRIVKCITNCLYTSKKCICLVCTENLQGKKKLIQHMSEFSHFPFKKIKGLECYYYCQECHKFFPSYLKAFKSWSNAHRCSGDKSNVRVIFGEKISTGSFPNETMKETTGTKRKMKDSQASNKRTKCDTTTGTKRKMKDSPASNKKTKCDTTTVTKRKMKDSPASNKRTKCDTMLISSVICEKDSLSCSVIKGECDRTEEAGNCVDETSCTSRLQGTQDDTLSGEEAAQSRQTYMETDSESPEMFKCDYCMVVLQSTQAMKTHMVEAKHRSASQVFVNYQGNPIYMKEAVKLTSSQQTFSLMAVCPETNCNQAFSDIFVCTEHYSYAHDQAADPVYAVAKVLSLSTQTYAKKKRGKKKALRQVDARHKTTTFVNLSDVAYRCLMCKCGATFSNDAMLHHHIRTHKLTKTWPNPMEVKEVYVSKIKERHSLLTFEPSEIGERASVKRQIESLRIMKRSLVKSGKDIRNKISRLKKYLFLQRNGKSKNKDMW